MKKFIKNNWFVSILIVVFAIVTVYYIVDSNKGKLKGKSVNGQDIVYEIAEENVSADDFYENLFSKNGSSAVTYLFTRSVADQAMETTEEMKETAKQQATAITHNFAQQYPSNYKEMLDHEMQQMGYKNGDDLESYLIVHEKTQKLTANYAKEHFDDLKIRNISYILVKAETPNSEEVKATKDEEKRMNEVDKAFKDGKDFADVAKEFSEDPSTAPTGGILGTLDKNTMNLDKTFLDTALSLNEGETSDWVHSEMFGWFKIHCNACTPETLETVVKQQNTPEPVTNENGEEVTPANAVEIDPYVVLVSTYDTTLTSDAIYAEAEKLGVDFHGNDKLKNDVLKNLGLNDKIESVK